MKTARVSDTIILIRLDPGDDIHTSVEEFCTRRGIKNATISGIGSVDSPTLAHYSMQSKHFAKLELPSIYEMTSLIGNIALIEGKPSLHAHVSLSDSEMNARGGHLVSGKCSATAELRLDVLPTGHTKTHSEEIGLNLWDFSD